MTNFDRILRSAKPLRGSFVLFLLATAFFAPTLRADSFSYSPDTLTFTPTSTDSVIAYVQIAYNGDTTGPGTYIHAWISDGSSYFGVPTDTIHTRSYTYLRVAYKPQTATVHGILSISDDTVTRTVVLIGLPAPQQEDAALSGYGPYFPTNIPEGRDTCTTMRLINPGSDRDTIVSAGWTHNPEGVFTWDSVSIPLTMPSHDTIFWTFCFNAPNNTTLYIDTFVIHYHDSASQTRIVSRIVEAQAYVPEDGGLTSYGPYFPTNVPEGKDTCTTMRLVNSGSDVDTIESMTWSHDPNGIFTWESASLPLTINSHDTILWTYCFNAPDNTTLNIDTLTIRYHDAASQSRYITRIVEAQAYLPEDGALELYDGPYFNGVVYEGHDTCGTMTVINSGDDVDTIIGAAWLHNPNGIFTWDSVSTPTTIGSLDTDRWTFCFHAPDDTNLYIDTFVVYYHDEYGQNRYITRTIEAKATDPSITTCYTLYGGTAPVTNIGDTSYIHMYIRNDLSTSATLTSCHISGTDDAAFHIDSSGFPNTIASDSYDSVWIAFVPNRHDGSLDYTATLTASFTTSDTSHCREASASLAGSMPQICSDTETVYFDTTGTDDVDLSGDSGHYYAHRIDFVNNSSETVIVSAVNWLHSSSHFLIAQEVPALPDTLAPGAGMAVVIHFYGDSSGTIYLDTLALTIGNSIAHFNGKFMTTAGGNEMFYVNVRGFSNAAPSSSVPIAAIPNAPELQLYPNPSAGLVNIQLDGSENATYEVIDILGHVIASHEGAGLWQWDASSASGISDGTYFIRASSADVSGNPLVTTKRFVLKR